MSATNQSFQAPIPGMSIAVNRKEYPYGQPPKFTNPQEALDYFWKQLHKNDVLKMIWYAAEKGADARRIAMAILYTAGHQGIIQLNLGIVISPILAQMIQTIAKAKGINMPMLPKMRSKVKDTMMHDKAQALVQHAQKVKSGGRQATSEKTPQQEEQDMTSGSGQPQQGLLQQAQQPQQGQDNQQQPQGGGQ